MGCGLISQRGPSVEVRHPISHDPVHRAAGARIVEHGTDGHGRHISSLGSGGSPNGSQGSHDPRGDVRIAGSRIAGNGSSTGSQGSHEHRGRGGEDGRQLGVPGRAAPGRRFAMGERVVLASRLPSYAQDHAFCFECGSFFQMQGAHRTFQCSRCGGSFVQFLRPPGNDLWIVAESATGQDYSFDDQLDTSISASLDETPVVRRPTQASFLRSLPCDTLTEEDIQARKDLDPKDPKCQCAICRDCFIVNDIVHRLPCGHEFHDCCIVPWLKANCSCPVCRCRLPEATEGEEENEDDCEDLVRLKRPNSAATTPVVGVPASVEQATDGTTVEGVPTTSQGSDSIYDLDHANASSLPVRLPVTSPIVDTSLVVDTSDVDDREAGGNNSLTCDVQS